MVLATHNSEGEKVPKKSTGTGKLSGSHAVYMGG
jgi:hypothetical protein